MPAAAASVPVGARQPLAGVGPPPGSSAEGVAARRDARRAKVATRPPLATSSTPATARGLNPATRYRAVPDTVPDPTWRRSTPDRRAANRLENGTAPTR